MSHPPLAGSLVPTLPASPADAAGFSAAGSHPGPDAPTLATLHAAHPAPGLAAHPAPGHEMLHATLTHALLALEQRLLAPEVRQNSAAVSVLLADEFEEVGKSGRTYTRAQILALLEQESPQTLHIEAFRAQPLGPEAALATYESVTATGTRAYRSSVWVYRQGRWQMLYHQGTVAAAG